jgi:hypothetical protein
MTDTTRLSKGVSVVSTSILTEAQTFELAKLDIKEAAGRLTDRDERFARK